MNNRTTFFIVLVAIVLALVVIFLEYDVSSVPYQNPDKFKVLHGIKIESVKKISLLAAGNQTVHLTRGGSRWFFERPLQEVSGYSVEWEADPEAVNRLVDLLVNLRESEPAIEGRPGTPLELVKYGLNKPQQRIEIVYGAGKGGRGVKLYLGSNLPGSRDHMYVRVNDENRVLIISDTLSQMMRLAQEGGFAFRSRKVCARDDLVDTSEVSLDTQAYRARFDLSPSGSLWEFRWVDKKGDPNLVVTARGSGDTVKRLAEAMQDLRVEQFVGDTASNKKLAQYGFTNPQAVISMTLAESSDSLLAMFSGPPSAYLRIGKEVEGHPDQVYAVAQKSSPMVFTIKKSFLDQLPKDTEALPAKRLVSFETSKVKSVTLVNSQGTLEATRKEHDWTLSSPLEMDGDHAGLNGLVDAVTTSDCTEVVWKEGKSDKDFGLASPQAVFTLRADLEKDSSRVLTEVIQVGKTFEKTVEKKDTEDDTKDENGSRDEKKTEVKKFVYVRRAGDVGIRVFEFDKFKTFMDTPLSFLKKRVMEFNSWDARSFTLVRPGERYEFEKKDDFWHMVKPASLKADQGNAGGLVSSMGWLNAESIDAYDPKTLAPYGLDKPAYRLEVVVKAEEKEEEKKDDEKKDDEKEDDEKKDGEKKDEEEKEKLETHVLILAVKKVGDKETLYGHVPGGRLIFTVDKSFHEKLDSEMADTEIFPNQWRLREATVECKGEVKRLTRNADGKEFKIAAGKEGNLEDVEKEKGEKFFEKLAGIKTEGRYVTYEAKDLNPYGLSKGLFASITSKDKDEKTTTLEVGKQADKAKHGEGFRYARRSGKMAVFLVKQEDLDALLKPATDFLPEKKEEEAKKDGDKKKDEKK